MILVADSSPPQSGWVFSAVTIKNPLFLLSATFVVGRVEEGKGLVFGAGQIDEGTDERR